MEKTVYLASPYGFSAQQKELLLPRLVRALESLGLEVWEPFARNNQINWSDPEAPYHVGQSDKHDVVNAKSIFAVVNGTPPDEGVMIELGIAIALNKPTFLFRDDFRRCTDSTKYPLNLMLFTGLGQYNWRDYYYTSVDELSNPDKALAKFAREWHE